MEHTWWPDVRVFCCSWASFDGGVCLVLSDFLGQVLEARPETREEDGLCRGLGFDLERDPKEVPEVAEVLDTGTPTSSRTSVSVHVFVPSHT